MLLKLKSDYSQNYDEAFDREGFEFSRMLDDGPTRPQMFSMFQFWGLSTPFFGYYKQFQRQFAGQDLKVVIHDDIDAHCGEGKRLKLLSEFDEHDKQQFLVEYINYPLPSDVKGKSTRYLFIGSRCFKYDYVSFQDWRSNYGDGDIIYFNEIIPIPTWRNKVYRPLFAVDFVGEMPYLKAIDYNVSPGLYKEIYKYMGPTQIVLTIKDWFREWINHE